MNTAQVNPEDHRDSPLYTLSAAARHLGLAPRTLRYWIVGRSYSRRSRSAPSKPLIRAPARTGLISFHNLVEAHVLRAFRSEDVGRMAATGDAIANAERALGVERLLLRAEMGKAGHAAAPSGQDLMLEDLAKRMELSESDRIAIRRILSASLERIERDEAGLPARLYPFAPRGAPHNRTVALDPEIAHGRPIVAGSRVETAALVARLDEGEALESVAAETGLATAQVVDAVLYERTR